MHHWSLIRCGIYKICSYRINTKLDWPVGHKRCLSSVMVMLQSSPSSAHHPFFQVVGSNYCSFSGIFISSFHFFDIFIVVTISRQCCLSDDFSDVQHPISSSNHHLDNRIVLYFIIVLRCCVCHSRLDLQKQFYLHMVTVQF